jgi:hypothetical protein
MDVFVNREERRQFRISERLRVCCAKTRGAIRIDSNRINNERIFIPDLYPQISQITADFIFAATLPHPQVGITTREE